MMMLSELAPVSSAALPVQGLKDHLRLGSGFADDGMQDGLIEAYLRAAMAAIEGRTLKALLARSYKLTVEDWRQPGEQPLPLAPVAAVTSVTVFDAAGAGAAVAGDRWRLVPDMARPRLASVGVLFPTVPEDGRVEIVFEAGFGATWGSVPPDLAQAVLLLAADYYETRHMADVSAPAGLPRPVQALIERWRTVRVLGGGAR